MAPRVRMPQPVELGEYRATTIAHPLMNFRNNGYLSESVMGYILPVWQRGIVWDEARSIKFIESLWRGIPVGTFTYNQLYDSPYDNMLIDGQQRMYSLQRYFEDRFPVFGCFYSETDIIDKRSFEMGTHFHCYVTKTNSEQYLRDYYNLMNFSGVAHKESERA